MNERKVIAAAKALVKTVERRPSGMWFVRGYQNAAYNAAFDKLQAALREQQA